MLKLNKKTLPGKRTIFDIITLGGVIIGVLALLALIYYQVVPIKLADIKVPVATDKASYYAGQDIKGIFFGDIYFKGQVRILREVFCADSYHRVIKPPAAAAVGDFFATQSTPHKLEGVTVPIGSLPDDAPLGSNCVLQFTNVYDIKTPFGTRHEEYQYYTENFSIVTREKRQELDSGISPQTGANTNTSTQTGDASSYVGGNGSTGSTQQPEQQGPTNITNNTTNNSTVNNPPVQAPADTEKCTFDALGIKLFCS